MNIQTMKEKNLALNKAKLLTSFGILVGFSILAGCATARVVEFRPGIGGVIAVNPAGSAEARQKADVLMSQNCQSRNFEIVEEGESVVGSTSQARRTTRPYNGLFGPGISSNHTVQTTNQTEWRIKYKCK